MTKKDPEDRASIQEIKESEWFQGSIYNSYELKTIIAPILGKKSH